MRKIYIIAIVAVLIIGAGWGGYWFKDNQGKNEKLKLDNLETTDNQLDELAKDWKTYRSEKLGFEIKYPSELAVDDEEKNKILFSNEEFYPLIVNYLGEINKDLSEIAKSDSYNAILELRACDGTLYPECNILKEKDDNREFTTAEIDKEEAILVTSTIEMTLIGEESIQNKIYLFYVKKGKNMFKISILSNIITNAYPIATEDFAKLIINNFHIVHFDQ